MSDTYRHLSETFMQAERLHPDLMEPYSIRLSETETEAERIAVMRSGLRETIKQRHPLKAQELVG